MKERAFFNTSNASLKMLHRGLEAVVQEAPPDNVALTCALLLGLVNHEMEQRKKHEHTLFTHHEGEHSRGDVRSCSVSREVFDKTGKWVRREKVETFYGKDAEERAKKLKAKLDGRSRGVV